MSGHARNDEPFLPAVQASEPAAEPATLFRVIQAAIGEELKDCFTPPRKMSHQLFVLMMQMNDRARRERVQAEQAERAKAKASRAKACKAGAGKRQDALPSN